MIVLLSLLNRATSRATSNNTTVNALRTHRIHRINTHNTHNIKHTTMTQEIIIPRGQNVGYSILNAIGNTKQHVKSIDLRRDIKNKCIIATILLVWIQ